MCQVLEGGYSLSSPLLVPKKVTKARQATTASTKVKLESDGNKSSCRSSSSSSSSSSSGVCSALPEPPNKSGHVLVPSVSVPHTEIDCPVDIVPLAVNEGSAQPEAVSTHGRVGRGKNKKYAEFDNTRTRKKDLADSWGEVTKGPKGASGSSDDVDKTISSQGLTIAENDKSGDSSATMDMLLPRAFLSGPGSLLQEHHVSGASRRTEHPFVEADQNASISKHLNSHSASVDQHYHGFIDSTGSAPPAPSVPTAPYPDRNSYPEDISTMFAQENGDGGLVKG